MAIVLGILLLAYWLIGPTLLSAFLPPAGRLGRDGTAVLIALVSWAILAFWLPLRIWPPRPAPLSFGLPALIALAVLYLAVFSFGVVRQSEADSAPGDGAFTVAVLSPLSEELLFRGFLLSLTLPLLGGYGAVAFSGLLFLGAHEIGRIGGAQRSLRETLADLLFGLLAATLVLVTGTVLPAIALHMLVNGLYAFGRRAGRP